MLSARVSDMAGGRCVVQSAILKGVEGIPVEVEVVVTSGLPAFQIVGMADAAVQESRERIKTALKQSGFAMPIDRVLVNLAPSSLKKSGSGLDLAIALGILGATGQIAPEIIKGRLFVGELSLGGRVRSVAGLLAYALCARDRGLDLIVGCRPDGLMNVDGLNQAGLDTLADLANGKGFQPLDERLALQEPPSNDYAEVAGNEVAKRALQIAAAGGHGLLMMGPPGSGKTMLASRLPTILPPLSHGELLQCALIHSVAGEDISSIMAGVRPFRAPHHSATSPSLIGGGNPIRPGEASLANGGVLFLDELAEFKSVVLQQIRQPMEEGRVRIARADGTLEFPASFMLVGATNPCPCGFFGDERHHCTCPDAKVRDYQNRIGGPLMDRIDMHIDVKRVAPQDVIAGRRGTSSDELRQGVLAARDYASWRLSREPETDSSSAMVRSCHLSEADEAFFEKAARSNAMSGRGILRTLAVARTIADMEERQEVSRSDLCEALGFRVRNGVGNP